MLPVAAVCDELIRVFQSHQTVILSAPPGAGKSTYLPLYLLQHGHFNRIIMLEPRRLAAKSIASYLAAQLGEEVGQTVGYQIRHEQKSSAGTRLLIVTEGILTRKIQQDPELQQTDLLIFDEFHERSLHADLALALALEVQQLRESLSLLVMSATLDTQLLSEKLSAPVLSSDGRHFPVDIHYVAPQAAPYWQQTAKVALNAWQQHQASILVFLPGQAEISQAAEWLQLQLSAAEVDIYPLIGSMTLAQQQQAIATAPVGKTKIVLATNLAETSLTIEGIKVVVDSGLCRRASFNPRQGVTTLETVAVSQAAAVQRAGRAGRLSAGICYRLDTAEKWLRRPQFEPAEIEIAELTALRLDVAVWGCQVTDLCWITTPPTAHLEVAEQLLQQLGALDTVGNITAHGRRLYQTGTTPRLANMLWYAHDKEQQGQRGILWLACLLTALLEESRAERQDIYQQLQQLQKQQAGYAMLWQQAKKFAAFFKAEKNHPLPLEWVPLLLLRAWPDRLANLRGQGYLLSSGAGAVLPPEHPLQQQPWLVVLQLQQWQQANRISQAVAIEAEHILQDWQQQLIWQDKTGFDDKTESFISEQQLCFGRCVLQKRRSGTKPDPQQKQQAWLQYIRRKGLDILPWTEHCQQLLARIKLIRHFFPAENWPDADAANLLEQDAEWLIPYLTNVNKSQQLQSIPLYDALLSRLSYPQQQQLQQLTPVHWLAPTGSRLNIDYTAEGGPLLSVRIQEMYGQMASPVIMQGKVTLTIALLSPGRQPLQLTRDLASFWNNTWKEVKKEMKGRYPKHYWPDNPAEAMPTTKTRKAMQQ